MGWKTAVVAWFAVAGGIALSQTPPCPCPEAPPSTPPLWTGKAEISFLSTSGNTDTSSFGGGLELAYKPAPWTFSLKAAYLRSSNEGILTAETFVGGVRGARDLTPRIDVFLGAGYLRNTFAGIESLINGETGAGYKLLTGPIHMLRGELGLGYARESVVTGFDRSYATARAGLGYKWQFSKNADFTNDLSFVEDLDETDNWIVTDKAAITATLTSIFSLKASWSFFYDNAPVPGFGKTDTATAVALVAKF